MGGKGEGGNRLKRGTWIVCRFKRGLGKTKRERRGDVFEVGGEGVETPIHTRVGGAFLLAQISKANNIVTQYYY